VEKYSHCLLALAIHSGKTIQSAAFLLQLQTNPSTKIRGPFLIVAPLSLVGQWQSELATWAPDMNVLLYHGSADARNFLVEQEFYYNDPFVQKSTASKLKKQRVTKFHVLITTYEVALKDAAVLSKIKWRVLIVDEAHRLKNHKSRLFDELASVPRDYCILLTGTPIANATEELFSLLHFSDPHVFSDRDEFMEKFGEMTDAKQVNELHSLLRPYLLRRVKEDVEKSLPPKEETILEVSLTPVQKAYYKAIYERNTAFLFKGAKPSNAPSLMNVMMELRKCCNHPFLVRGAEERILNDAATKVKEKTGETTPNIHQVFADQLVKSSGKMVLMEKLLQKLFDGGHKVLIFSQMVRVLDLLEELLKIKRYRYERLDGSTSSTARLSAVDRFKRKSCQRFVMLLSTRAGGLGLNLTAADIVIIFDSDWNPQNDLQAMARAHRIGQQRSVKIYRFLTAKTYEMHMFHSASLKLGLERAVLSQNRDQADDGDDSKSKKKSDREAQAKAIDELLKKGAYDVFRDEDDKEAEKFMESDIDQLLENSSKKVTYGASNSSAGNGLGSFSKASFVADTGSGEKDVDLDDPDFWSKAVGLDAPVEIPEEVAAMIDDGVKRSRKQVQVYDPFADTREAEQLKKDRIAMEKMLEKEDKERAKMEKKMKKDAVKEKRKRERDDIKTNVAEKKAAVASVVRVVKEEKKKVFVIEAKPKKSKKSDRQRALRRAENENPVLEQLRQAWEVPHRNKATAAMLRFGVSRFCKIRSEANLSSLPLQDVEVFARAFVYQVALQAGVNLLHVMRSSSLKDLRTHLPQWLGDLSESETNWVAGSIISCLEQHAEVESGRRFLRIPVILCEPTYVSDLRNGGALRALRRLGVLMRLNSFVEKCLDSVLSALGHEELGKRGCASSDLSLLDADLKARYVTTEELSLAISASFKRIQSTPPANWWGRSCDVALIAGTFVHGLGNYKAMRADPELPFSERIRKHTSLSGSAAHDTFVAATNAARKVFDDALEAGRIKAELEVQAAVAAAAKMASKREEDAAKLRGGGDGVESVIRHYDTQVSSF
jgi:chromodomain-helicase-DNA-binding protein 7